MLGVRVLLPYIILLIQLSMKTIKTWTVHFFFSLRIFISTHVIIISITVLGMFTNICLVLLLLPASLLSKNCNNFSNVLFEAVKSSCFSRVKMREGFRRELMSMEIIIACTTLLIQVDGPYNNQEGALNQWRALVTVSLQ